jgi:hypothetical protein
MIYYFSNSKNSVLDLSQVLPSAGEEGRCDSLGMPLNKNTMDYGDENEIFSLIKELTDC